MSADLFALQPTCPPSARPERLFDPASGVHGLRAARARLAGPDRLVDVWLYRDPPAALADPALWTLVAPPGGTGVAVSAATIVATPQPHVQLTLAGLPDPSRYRLEVAPPAGVPFDPLRTWLALRLRPECPDLGSCFDTDEPPPRPASSPVKDYLARDWRALRQGQLEHLLASDPAADVSIADPVVALIELFAHVGDLLNYRLDRTATEAYLESARLRTSVKRHARLVDFALSDGLAAEVAVQVVVAPAAAPVPVAAGSVAVPGAGSDLAFTLEQGVSADAGRAEIPIYDWGEEACCLPAGATECVLVRPQSADPLGDGWLAAGDLLAFEVVDPDDEARHRTWAQRQQLWPTDAAGTPRFREPLPSRTAQIVQLTAVEPFSDPLMGATLELFRVRWSAADALERPYSVGIDTSAGGPEVTVARANLVRAHHGRRVDGPAGTTLRQRLPDWADADEPQPPREFSMIAAGTPGRSGRGGGAGLSIAPARPPERAEPAPHLLAVSVRLPSLLNVQAGHVASLIDARPGELAFVVDIEEREPPILRFATGAVGLVPPLGSVVTAAYEVGGGVRGNIAANALSLLEADSSAPGQAPAWSVVEGVRVRNPVAARGGSDPTPLETVRRDAPEAFAAQPRRAVLAVDHAVAVSASALVERAMAQRVWSGSWPLISTVVDLTLDGLDAQVEAERELQALLEDLRMLGTEVAVIAGTPVGLLVALDVCARPGNDPEQVRRDVLALLRPGSAQQPGVFHASRLALGAAIYLSAVVATVAALPSVDAVQVREARRLSDPPGTAVDVIAFGPDEVGVLDDDPSRPERGRLDVLVRGGR